MPPYSPENGEGRNFGFFCQNLVIKMQSEAGVGMALVLVIFPIRGRCSLPLPFMFSRYEIDTMRRQCLGHVQASYLILQDTCQAEKKSPFRTQPQASSGRLR